EAVTGPRQVVAALEELQAQLRAVAGRHAGELRKLANSVRVALPRMMAPARRSFWVMNASFAGIDPPSAIDPAVVGISAVSILSLRMTGTPNNGFLRPSSSRSSTFKARAA